MNTKKQAHQYTYMLAAPEGEFVPDFVQKMANRMAVSFHKYGAMREGYPEHIDAIASLRQRLDRYAETGNTEWLVDVANFAMIEFALPRHVDAHFAATDSDASPGRTRTTGGVDAARNDFGTSGYPAGES